MPVTFILRLTCICSLCLNAVPRKRDAEGFATVAADPVSREWKGPG